jgi:hypothetical protein
VKEAQRPALTSSNGLGSGGERRSTALLRLLIPISVGSQVSAEALQPIIKAIDDNRFFRLKAEYRNPLYQGGLSQYLCVTLGNREHPVSQSSHAAAPRQRQAVSAFSA